ncbi:hypothetical protein AB6A40_005122 [Gnathostoma spinigerum]|uniref:Uncharacterized protein n=1 Tax=Gnathostoma spinigerum TaxID=75299 RepID=A0ABD6EEJ2_9BILA
MYKYLITIVKKQRQHLPLIVFFQPQQKTSDGFYQKTGNFLERFLECLMKRQLPKSSVVDGLDLYHMFVTYCYNDALTTIRST